MNLRSNIIPLGLLVVLSGIAACSGEGPSEELGHSAEPLTLKAQTAALTPTDDARIQGGSPDGNFGSAQLWVNTEASHYSLVKFDLNEIPTNATIESAQLVLRYSGDYVGERTVELGAVDAGWTEDEITWNNQPTISWGGPTATVDGDTAHDVQWDVTTLVQQWQSGAKANEGFALRGQGNGPGKIFHSKDTSSDFPPRLLIKYRAPVLVGPLPDSADAADSTNHLGVVNLAYPGVPGQFPTVRTMAGPAGPRHANPTLWGLLGKGISAELDADVLPDSDGPANILLDAAGVASITRSNRDRLDDGWLNRNRLFVDCQRETLQVRVSRASAQQGIMYLNAWFDGNHDGDWADAAPCTPPSGGPAVPSSEYILRDQPVNMNAIPAGGFVDLMFNTERVLNTSLRQAHWVRFTLSEAPAVVPPVGLPDGRGKPFAVAPNGFVFGETEDYVHHIPLGEPGELVLEKRVLGAESATYPDVVKFQLKLKHVGGTTPVQASIRDLLPLPLDEMHVISSVTVIGTPSGAGPLEAEIAFEPNSFKHGVRWDGALAPNSEVRLEFAVHVHVDCLPFVASKNVTNVARATGGGQALSAEATFRADCPGTVVAVPNENLPNVNELPIFYP
jgi:hypothetical protein